MIVGNLCKTDVVTVACAESVVLAARLMRERHVGMLVAVEPGTPEVDLMPVGVLTDRDIVTAVVAKDADPHALNVGDVMTRHPLLADENQSVEGTLRLMREFGVRRVPVVGTRGQLTGVLSLDDVIEALASQFSDAARTIANERTRERAIRS